MFSIGQCSRWIVKSSGIGRRIWLSATSTDKGLTPFVLVLNMSQGWYEHA
jgi:hypothetical protein